MSPSRVFEGTGGWFRGAIARGAHMFGEQIALLSVGAIVAAGLIATSPDPIVPTSASFTELVPLSEARGQWHASVTQLESILSDMQTGARSSLGAELSPLAKTTLASVRTRTTNVESWADALALEVGDLDD